MSATDEERFGEAFRAARRAGPILFPQFGVPTAGDVGAGAWPDPIDFLADDRMTGAPPLAADAMPEVLRDFVFDHAERMGVDASSMLLAALVTCAAVVTDDWRIQPKRHDDTWTERPCIWGGIVGDPSILKTPVIGACTAPVDKLEVEARRTHTEAMRRYRADHAAWKKNKDASPDDEPRQPKLPRYLVEGTTIEALSEVLRDDDESRQFPPARKVLCRQDEMSEWIGGMDRYKGGGNGSSDRGAYLRLYNGNRYTSDRIGRGSFAVPSWSACIIGGIQPEPIQRIAKDQTDDGLLQRFMFVVAGKCPKGVDRPANREATKRYEALILALTALRPEAAQNGRPTQHVVMHAAAHQHREAIDTLTASIAALPDTSSRLRSALGKWPGLFPRVALIFHLIEIADARARNVEGPPLTVLQEPTARRAATYLRTITLPHLLRADALMFQSVPTGHARWIAGFILAKGLSRIGLRDVVQAYGPLRDLTQRRELLDVMEGLVMMAWLSPEEPANAAKQISAWQVNPKVHTLFAARATEERERRKAAMEATQQAIRARAKEQP